MSEAADREDRTEAPSPKRLREARERGDVPRSRELANVAVLGATAVALLASSGYMARTSLGWMHGAPFFGNLHGLFLLLVAAASALGGAGKWAVGRG